MGFLLVGVRYVSFVLMFALATLCLACGLYYLAELIEEHEKLTKKILKYILWFVLGVHLLIYFEGFPISYILFGLVSHGTYYLLLDKFPQIKLSSVLLWVSVVFFLINHSLWFSYFTSQYHYFWDVFGFFSLCVWLVPFIFFVSLTVDDNSLPYGSLSASGESIGDEPKKKGNRIVKIFQRCMKAKDRFFSSGNSRGAFD